VTCFPEQWLYIEVSIWQNKCWRRIEFLATCCPPKRCKKWIIRICLKIWRDSVFSWWFRIFDNTLISTEKHNHNHKHTYIVNKHWLIGIILKMWWQYMSWRNISQSICSLISSLHSINYLKHRISYTSVNINDTDFTQQFGVVNKQFRLNRIKFVSLSNPTTEHGNIVIEQRLGRYLVWRQR
jgi:hypothetical protein